MAYEVRYAGSFKDELEDTCAYLARELGNPSAAGTFLKRLKSVHELLESAPESCPHVDDPFLCRRGYRKARAGNYLVIFRVSVEYALFEDGSFRDMGEVGLSEGIVRVVHLFHTSQDWPSLM